MKIKRLVRELRRKLRKDEESPSARLKLAAAYRESGRGVEAVDLYLDVALEYRKLGRIAQAIAVCRSALDIDPANDETQELLAELERLREAEPAASRGRAATAPGVREGGALVEDDGRSWTPSLVSPARPAPSRSRPGAAAGSERPGADGAVAERADTESDAAGAPPPAARSGGAAGARGEASPDAARDARPGKAGDAGSGGQVRRAEDEPSSAYLSGSLLTPTPLPAPLPPHEADDDSREIGHLFLDPVPAGSLPRLSLPGDLAPVDDDLFDLPPPADMVASLPDALLDAYPFDRSLGEEDTQIGTSPGGVPVAEDAFRDDAFDPPASAPPDLSFEHGLSGPTVGAMGDEELTWLKDALPRAPSEPEPILFSGSADGRFLAGAPAREQAPGMEVPGAALPVDGAPELVVDEDRTMRQVIPGVFLPGVPAPVPTAAAGGSLLDMLRAAFDTLSAEVVGELAERVIERRIAGGEHVFREGDPGDACFLVASGELRAVRRDPFVPGEPSVEVSRWGAGALFGELALLADRRRHASVQAVGACQVYEIPRRLLRELAATYPEVGSLLDAFYRARLLSLLIDTAPFLNTLPGPRRTELQARFRFERRSSGEPILREGSADGGLYLVVQGSVEITKRVSAKRSTLLATFVEGAYFGDMSWTEGGAACVSVIAAGPVELAVLPPDELLGVVAESPGVWAQIRETARRRELERNELLTGETPMV